SRPHTRFSRDWSSDVCSSDLRFVPSVGSCRARPDLSEVPRPFRTPAMTQIPGAEERDERVLILAPSRRDGPTVAAILERAGLARSEERRVGQGWWPRVYGFHL